MIDTTSNIIVPPSDEPRLTLLKKYAAYSRQPSPNDCQTTYALYGQVPDVLEKYSYSQYTQGQQTPDDALAFRLLDFVCDHFQHNGTGGHGGASMVENIAFCEQHGGKTNCRGLAIILSSLLRLNGIKARHITCMPYEEPFMDCHVVVDCLLPSGARVMLDPTNRLYYRDAQGAYVSLCHLREMLLDGQPLFHNDSASYNGGSFDAADNIAYMCKNTLRFQRSTDCRDGVDTFESCIDLIPALYPAENFCEERKRRFVYDDQLFWMM